MTTPTPTLRTTKSSTTPITTTATTSATTIAITIDAAKNTDKSLVQDFVENKTALIIVMLATIIIITIILVSIACFAKKILRDKKKINSVEKVHEKVVTPTVPRVKYVNDCAFTSESQSLDLYDDPYDDPYVDYNTST
jgi:hypothetical protein